MNLTDSTLLKTENYINGTWCAGGAGTIEVLNPATGKVVAVVANGNAQDTETAVEAASEAFVSWSKTTAKQRSDLLRNWFNLIVENAEDLGKIMTSEQGKPLAEAIGAMRPRRHGHARPMTSAR